VKVLAIDPGAGGAGYCVWDGALGFPAVSVLSRLPSDAVDVIVVESGFIGRMGRQAMWGLGFDVGWRLHEAWLANCALGPRLYTIRPDGPNGWRAALPAKPGTFLKYDGLPGDVIVARLRERYEKTLRGVDWSALPEHQIEAMGIAEAAAAILARPKASQRRALKPVKR
jgi:hypothetical protein